MTQLHFPVLFLVCHLLQFTAANVEKVVFLGPATVQVPRTSPTLEDLKLHTLSPQNSIVRTEVRAEFPSTTSIWGESSWLLLEQLVQGQRYEVRICWAATQPTSFRLSIYELSDVFDSPELISSLAAYSESRQSENEPHTDQIPSISRRKSYQGSEQLQSVLLLRILAAADYYTTNRTLMEHVPPVLIDVILDPYILNVFPRSLVPTGVYLVIIAISSWFLAKYISQWLHTVGVTEVEKKTA